MKEVKNAPSVDSGDTRANPSGAPDAGGATTAGSSFGGWSIEAKLLRAVARFARSIEAGVYRRLRELDLGSDQPGNAPGRPNRVRGAALPHEPHPIA